MNKLINAALTLSLTLSGQLALAEPIENFRLQHMQARSLWVKQVNAEKIYAVSCSVSATYFTAQSVSQKDNLSLHVNPGEVTDRYGNHGVKSVYTLDAPVGQLNFYAQPDASGGIDFSFANNTQRDYFIECNINRQYG